MAKAWLAMILPLPKFQRFAAGPSGKLVQSICTATVFSLEEEMPGVPSEDYNPADGWELYHWWRHQQRISLKPAAGVKLTEAAAILRNSFPELREKSPSEVLRELKETGCLRLRGVLSKDAWKIRQTAEELQFEVVSEDISQEQWMPVNRITKVASLEDDDERAAQIVRMMLQAGAKIIEMEVD